MPGLLPNVDPNGLLEYSVVFTDRSLNHMSASFQGVMRDVAATLKRVYRGPVAVIVPGGGTAGMESVARQLVTGGKALVIRNGWFSYRWTQIFDMGRIPAHATVLKARPVRAGSEAPFAPPPIDDVVRAIRDEKPDVVFAPHVETASGMLLPDTYLRAVADAVHAHGGLFVLDCIASGAIWVDMGATAVDVVISAPQKGWSSSPGAALIVMSQAAREKVDAAAGTSYTLDLKRWLGIMEAYEKGGHAYHSTMPTDTLRGLRDAMQETERFGFERARAAQQELGAKVRALFAAHGLPSVAAPGFEAPGVVVSYTRDKDIHSGAKFIAQGLQTAAGVPLQCDEPADFRTFRVGLFGLDKLANVDRTVGHLERALQEIAAPATAK
ncbi:MAG: alanine--glyoxylate aminotransferase family protein [Burkholderiales bacterium]|nr:alanine--glyoxylate aminotransferase family protein [Burkholderiales bacterium]